MTSADQTLLFRARRRSGAAAVEFAMLMPVFVALIAGLLELSWLLFMRSSLLSAVREGCRSGAMVEPDDIPDPEQVTEEAVEAWLSRYRIGCSGEGAVCDVSTELLGESPTESLQCALTLEYDGLTGLIPVPEQLRAVAEVRLERQR